jgi:hypothetical protein
MMWTNKGFEIWMGDAGSDLSRSVDTAARIDAQAFEGTLFASDPCADANVAGKAGWLTRTISAITDRAQLPRIARG